MNTKITLALLVSVLLLSYTNIRADHSRLTIDVALKMASEQQVLAQRIANVYMALCYNNRSPELFIERTNAIEQFDNYFFQLSLFIPTNRVKEHIQNVRSKWQAYKKIADWSIKREVVYDLLVKLEDLAHATRKLHAAYQEYAYSVAKENLSLATTNQYIKLITNQQILLEKAVLYYLVDRQSIAEVEDLNIYYTLTETRASFLRSLSVLEKSKLPSADVEAKLAEIRAGWERLEKKLTPTQITWGNVEDVLIRAAQLRELTQELFYSYKVDTSYMLESKL